MMLLQLTSPTHVAQLHPNNITSITFIRMMGGTFSPTPCKESLLFWCQAIQRDLAILPPIWLASEENTEANFLSRDSLKRWNLKLASREFLRVCQRLQVWPTQSMLWTTNWIR